MLTTLIMCLFLSLYMVMFLMGNLSPLTLSWILLMYSVLVSILLGLSSMTWLFYFIMLVFLGGVMIVVMFMSSVCMNKKLHMDNPFNLMILSVLMILSSMIDHNKIVNSSFGGMSIGSFLYNLDNSMLLMFMFIILLAILMAVVMMVKLEVGPLLKRL